MKESVRRMKSLVPGSRAQHPGEAGKSGHREGADLRAGALQRAVAGLSDELDILLRKEGERMAPKFLARVTVDSSIIHWHRQCRLT